MCIFLILFNSIKEAHCFFAEDKTLFLSLSLNEHKGCHFISKWQKSQSLSNIFFNGIKTKKKLSNKATATLHP